MGVIKAMENYFEHHQSYPYFIHMGLVLCIRHSCRGKKKKKILRDLSDFMLFAVNNISSAKNIFTEQILGVGIETILLCDAEEVYINFPWLFLF